jgi:hypothetical protein
MNLSLIDAGFFMKRIEVRPASLNAPGVREICSVSHCISPAPENWIQAWLHNDLGWFNRIADALTVVRPEERHEYRLFGYRVFPEVFTAEGRDAIVLPENVKPEAIGQEFRSLGFDSTNKTMESVLGFECSPLSCNAMAEEIRANKYCLFATLDEAIAGAERFATEQPEPGSYFVIEVLEGQQLIAGG